VRDADAEVFQQGSQLVVEFDAYCADLGVAEAAELIAGPVEGQVAGLGGLVVQILVDRGLGAAGVAINPAPPAVSLRPSLIRGAGFALLRGSVCRSGAITLTRRQFHRALAGTLDDQQALMAYTRYAVPAPGPVIRQAALPQRARVRFDDAERAPLLLIGSGKDRIFPASLTRAGYRRYARSDAVTVYRE
jgi:hypothetical protein